MGQITQTQLNCLLDDDAPTQSRRCFSQKRSLHREEGQGRRVARCDLQTRWRRTMNLRKRFPRKAPSLAVYRLETVGFEGWSAPRSCRSTFYHERRKSAKTGHLENLRECRETRPFKPFDTSRSDKSAKPGQRPKTSKSDGANPNQQTPNVRERSSGGASARCPRHHGIGERWARRGRAHCNCLSRPQLEWLTIANHIFLQGREPPETWILLWLSGKGEAGRNGVRCPVPDLSR